LDIITQKHHIVREKADLQKILKTFTIKHSHTGCL